MSRIARNLSQTPDWTPIDMEALADPAHEYHEEALDAMGDDHDPHAPPNIDMIHASFAALAKKWAPRTRKVK